MLAWALSSVARKGAVCYYSVSEFMGLLGQFDANAATLKGISSKRLLKKKERNPPYSKRICAALLAYYFCLLARSIVLPVNNSFESKNKLPMCLLPHTEKE